MQLRRYQQTAVDYAYDFLMSAHHGHVLCMDAPTGTGKSLIELALQTRINSNPDNRCWIITPRVEIVQGLLGKLEIDHSAKSLEAVHNIAASYYIATPIRFRNRLLEGAIEPPTHLTIDEVHHETAETYQQIAALCGYVPTVGFTATPFRGTAKGTSEFRERWGESVSIITMKEATDEGYIAFPSCKTLGLVDDDSISIQNGEFVVKEVEDATISSFDALHQLCQNHWHEGYYDYPTIISMPGTESAKLFLRCFGQGYYDLVSQDTPNTTRQKIFEECLKRRIALLHVNIVSEGVDLPLRRYIDCAPTTSPVMFLQRLGRIMRPSDTSPEYICTNRNLLRHGYLLEGCLPPDALIDAQKQFPECRRGLGDRVIGLEALGRLRSVEVPFADGLKGELYCVERATGNKIHRIAALVHPCSAEVLWAEKYDTKSKQNPITGNWEMEWGKWSRMKEAPTHLEGFLSAQQNTVTDKQRTFWQNCAASYGLDPKAKLTRKNFAALPVLRDMGIRLR